MRESLRTAPVLPYRVTCDVRFTPELFYLMSEVYTPHVEERAAVEGKLFTYRNSNLNFFYFSTCHREACLKWPHLKHVSKLLIVSWNRSSPLGCEDRSAAWAGASKGDFRRPPLPGPRTMRSRPPPTCPFSDSPRKTCLRWAVAQMSC